MRLFHIASIAFLLLGTLQLALFVVSGDVTRVAWSTAAIGVSVACSAHDRLDRLRRPPGGEHDVESPPQKGGPTR